jgi:hypothetical protein
MPPNPPDSRPFRLNTAPLRSLGEILSQKGSPIAPALAILRGLRLPPVAWAMILSAGVALGYFCCRLIILKQVY